MSFLNPLLIPKFTNTPTLSFMTSKSTGFVEIPSTFLFHRPWDLNFNPLPQWTHHTHPHTPRHHQPLPLKIRILELRTPPLSWTRIFLLPSATSASNSKSPRPANNHYQITFLHSTNIITYLKTTQYLWYSSAVKLVALRIGSSLSK